MAEILRFVDPASSAGGDGTVQTLTGATRAYVSLSAWEAATQQDLTAGGGNTARVVCSSNLDAGSGAADTTLVLVDGWTTSATCYITIEANSSHGGKWNANIYRLECTAGNIIRTPESFVNIYGIQIQYTTSSDTYAQAIYLNVADSAGVIKIGRCIIKGVLTGTAANIRGVYTYHATATFTFYVYNCMFYDLVNGTNVVRGVSQDTAPVGYVYNNTFQNCRVGLYTGTNKLKAVNNLFKGMTGSPCSGTFLNGTDYNATDSASLGYTVTGGGNTHDRLSQTFTFVDETNDDFHLASTDAGARDYGVSDPGSGLFSDDIDGVTRTGTWDIGADEYVAAGGGTILPMMMHHHGG